MRSNTISGAMSVFWMLMTTTVLITVIAIAICLAGGGLSSKTLIWIAIPACLAAYYFHTKKSERNWFPIAAALIMAVVHQLFF